MQSTPPPSVERSRPKVQLYVCIDDRYCSLRRHVENIMDNDVETFGVAGFFGMPIRYQPLDASEQVTLAPEGNNPTAILIERSLSDVDDLSHLKRYDQRRRAVAKLTAVWEAASFSPVGSLLLSILAPLSMARLGLLGFAPKLYKSLKERVLKNILLKPKTDVRSPFTPEEAAAMLARTLKDLGTQNRFAPIIIVLGHGASSINNPFAAAYNCGACGGREVRLRSEFSLIKLSMTF